MNFFQKTKPSEIFWSLFLSIPVGIGVSLSIMRSTGGNLTEPLVFVPGLLSFLFIFLIIILSILTPEDSS
jgi:hypothetical protein